MNIPATFQEALALQAAGQLAEALSLCDRILAAAPDHADTHLLRGRVLSALGRVVEAADAFSRATACAPNHVDAWIDLSAILLMLYRSEEAIVAADRAIALQPDCAAAYHNRAMAHDHLGHDAQTAD